jgi:uncharacterized protein (TIGR02145 family)
MKKLLFLSTIFCVFNVNAQSYLISFSGSGASTVVNSVKVENLRTGAILTLNGSDVLRLNLTTGISEVVSDKSTSIKIFPNPMTDKSKLLITPPSKGDAIISVCDINGKQLTRIDSYLENFTHEFSLSGLKSGTYFIYVKGGSYQLTGKLISNGKSNGVAVIENIGTHIALNEKVPKLETKGIQEAVDMEYAEGDIFKLTAISGDYSTVTTLIPGADITVTFDFVACSDGDGNNYTAVKIGDQTWMAENLKATKYNDGNPITLVENNTEWSGLDTPGYCWYNNDEATYKDTYGALYNWYAVNTGLLCPDGWHVSTDPEWTVLAGTAGFASITGNMLKETGTLHWTTPNTGATNETGFTALPGGYRYDAGGSYNFLGGKGFWWTSTQVLPVESESAWHRELTNGAAYILRNNYGKKTGFSVRCILD